MTGTSSALQCSCSDEDDAKTNAARMTTTWSCGNEHGPLMFIDARRDKVSCPVRQSDGYRAYVFGPDGRLRQRVDLICADDDAAKEQTKRLAISGDAELWQGARLVCIYRHLKTQSPDG